MPDAALGIATPPVAVEAAFAMLTGRSWEDSWSEVANFGGLASEGGGGRWRIASRRSVDGDVGGAVGCCRIATLAVVMASGLASSIAEFVLKTRMYRSRLWNI